MRSPHRRACALGVNHLAQFAQCLAADARNAFEPHDRASGSVEHPARRF